MSRAIYLTEENLGSFLKERFPEGNWIRDKSVPNSGVRYRPDYRNDFYKLIVEFNGIAHYSSPKRIVADEKKRALFTTLGYEVIEIPYFIQLNSETITHVFKNFEISLNPFLYYPQGFISTECPLPAEFCDLGILRFKQEFSMFNVGVQTAIAESLLIKIKELGDIRLVLPSPLEYLVENLSISQEAMWNRLDALGKELGIFHSSWECNNLPKSLNFNEVAFEGKFKVKVFNFSVEVVNPTYADIWRVVDSSYSKTKKFNHKYIEQVELIKEDGSIEIHLGS